MLFQVDPQVNIFKLDWELESWLVGCSHSLALPQSCADWPPDTEIFCKWKSISKYLLMPAPKCPNISWWIMLSYVLCLTFEICTFAKFRVDLLYSHNSMLLLSSHTGKQKKSPLAKLTLSAKGFENEKPRLSCIDFWNLSKISPKFPESSFHSKKKSQRGLVSKNFKAL